ncbi:hypothetical protein OFN53_38775, partial [Escherichia coli]|nr:hypothetical protein [Escherichia coli]
IREAEAAMAVANRNCPDFITKRNFLDAVVVTSKAAIRWANRFAELAERTAATDTANAAALRAIAANCRAVPANPATSFHEALQ